MLLVVPHGSYRFAAYAEAARQLGVELVIVSDGAHSLVPELAQGIQVDFTRSAEAQATVVAQLAPTGVQAVVATDDASVELAAEIARGLGLAHNSPRAARLSRRKDLARDRLREAGVPVPQSLRIPIAHLLEPGGMDSPLPGTLSFPLVVKPLALSASRGVIRVDDPGALMAAVRRIDAILQSAGEAPLAPEERESVLLERYLPGSEIALEGLLEGGQLRVLAIFDKPDPLHGPYFEETYYVTPSRHDPRVLRQAQACVQAACLAYGLCQGPVHAELRISDGQTWIIEVAARTIGGECARLLQFGSNESLEMLVIRNALAHGSEHLPGHCPGHPPRGTSPLKGARGVLMIPVDEPGVLRRVEGVRAASQVSGITDVVISLREGHVLEPLPEAATYLGFVFAQGEYPHHVEQALRQAKDCLRVVCAPLLARGGVMDRASL